ncbi:MAG: PD40 domain-containing protein [Bryobacteraceae bacterium]|nr:PD40 domain-containing protein [Bryobacteraceae bacterium]
MSGRLRPAIALAVVGVLAALGCELANRHGGRQDRPPSRAVPVTSFPGSKDFPCFSPDGSRIAFSWDGNHPSRQWDLYVQVIGAGEPLQLTRDPVDDMLPEWSPDGRYIAFCRRMEGFDAYAIYVIPALGGAERKIAEARAGVSWSPDGETLALARGGIILHSLDTGTETQITSPEPHTDGLPVFSPDGKWIALTRSFSASSREVFVVSARGGAARQLTFDNRPTFGVSWSADSREIVFSSNRGDSGEGLWRIRADGGTPAPVPLSSLTAYYPAISRRGNRLAYSEAFEDLNIYRHEGSGFGGGRTPGPFSAPKILIQSSRKDTSPAFSPDGEKITFVSTRSGNDEIWVCSRTGGNLAQITSIGGAPTGSPRWSPDGRWIAFDSRPGASSEIFVVSAEGGPPRQLTFDATDDAVPAWSHDGRWIYFISNRGSGDQIWKMPSEGGPAGQITRTGAREAWASPDGRLVYFNKWAPGIWSVPVDGGPEKLVPGLELAHKSRSWGVQAQGIYFVSADGPGYAIRFQDARTGKITRLATLDKEPFWNAPVLALSPDGRSLLYVRLDYDVKDIMVVEGFR